MAKSDAVAQSSDYQVILRKASELVPYARNTRTHSDEQIGKIMASLVEFGFTRPIMVDNTGIVAGHGTTVAALRLYEAGKTVKTPGGKALATGYVPTLDVTGWTDAQRRAYVIADNAIAEQAGWDVELLKIEIGDLETAKFNVDLLGFDADELSKMLFPDAGKGPNTSGESEVVPDGYAEQYGVIVVCKDAAHQEEVFEKLQADGYNIKVVVT